MPRAKKRSRSPRGMGGLYKRGRRYWASFRVPSPDGEGTTQVLMSTKCGLDEEGDARQFLARCTTRVADGDYHWQVDHGGRPRFGFGPAPSGQSESDTPTRHDQVRFSHMVDWIERDYRARGRGTLQEMTARARNHLLPFFRDMRADDIRATHIQAYTDRRLSSGARAATVNRELAILRRMFALGMEHLEILERRPRIQALPEHNARPGFFEKEDLDRILPHLPQYLRPAVSFAYSTGWRMKSEVLRLEWDSVDFDAGEVRLWAGSTKEKYGRVISMTDEERGLLLEQWRQHEEEYPKCPRVFHRAGKPIVNPQKAWVRAREAAGLGVKLMHDMRRSATRNLVRAGVSEKLAMERTGHRTRSVFDRYNISTATDRREVAEKLNRSAQGNIDYRSPTVCGPNENPSRVTH